MYKVMGRINVKCVDGKKADTIEGALENYKSKCKEGDRIHISVCKKGNDDWVILSDSEIEQAKQLTNKVFGSVSVFSVYPPLPIRSRI